MCYDSGVNPRTINIRNNDSIIGLARSFVRNSHHKMKTHSCIMVKKKKTRREKILLIIIIKDRCFEKYEVLQNCIKLFLALV